MRQEKQLLLDEIKEKLDNSSAFVITAYNGLKANDANELREVLGKADAEFEVVRKRVLGKAAEAAGLEFDFALDGHIGVLFAGEDAVEAIKIAVKHDSLKVIGGQVDGRLYQAAEIEQISKLPSRDGMRAELLGLFEAPQAQTLAVMESLLSSVPCCLMNKVEKEEGSD